MSKARPKIVHLPVQLTDVELRAKGRLQALGMIEYADIEDEKKRVCAKLTQDLREKRKELDRLANEVRTGFETRPVECDLVPVWETHTVVTLRRDTREQIDSRPMTPAERQLRLRAVFEPDDDDDEDDDEAEKDDDGNGAPH